MECVAVAVVFTVIFTSISQRRRRLRLSDEGDGSDSERCLLLLSIRIGAAISSTANTTDRTLQQHADHLVYDSITHPIKGSNERTSTAMVV